MPPTYPIGPGPALSTRNAASGQGQPKMSPPFFDLSNQRGLLSLYVFVSKKLILVTHLVQVKGGGHSSNPGFSSTKGVHISMKQFDEVTYLPESETVIVGAGLTWDEVYARLAPHGVNVVGGRVTGVGVAGFMLGGGYSWLSNQRGLGIDNVVAYELVKPTGEVVTVTKTSDPELYFGLRGGMNNFGIVTRFVLKAYPQGKVWGGVITYTTAQVADITAATSLFSSTVTDPKASIITTYNYVLGQLGVALILFYDGPTPPPGLFDKFLSIPSFTRNIKTRSFLSLVEATPVNTVRGLRMAFDSVPIAHYTPRLLDTIVNETVFWGKQLRLKGGLVTSYDVEPFLPSIFTVGLDATSTPSTPFSISTSGLNATSIPFHSSFPVRDINITSSPFHSVSVNSGTAASSPSSSIISTSAYPPSRNVGLSPFIICFAWTFETFDHVFHNAIKESASRIREVALEEGQTIPGYAVYPNYALYDIPLENLYGKNLPRLRELKKVVDPNNVMDLAGGFRL
ncbi:hypothetical protein H0H92_010846 [Tricholoma furcatifolium]|nr:hypothetical protein H0H92_010846 [Tricholoma furcatifolium]